MQTFLLVFDGADLKVCFISLSTKFLNKETLERKEGNNERQYIDRNLDRRSQKFIQRLAAVVMSTDRLFVLFEEFDKNSTMEEVLCFSLLLESCASLTIKLFHHNILIFCIKVTC